MRHGISKSNLIKDQNKYPDSPLSKIGIDLSKKSRDAFNNNNEKLIDRYKDYDLFLTSELTRTMETGINFLNNDQKIYVIPFINEQSSHLEFNMVQLFKSDIPNLPKNTLKKLNKKYNLKNKLSLNIHEKIMFGNNSISNVNNFLEIFLLCGLLEKDSPNFIKNFTKNKNRGTKKNPYKILIFCHQNYINYLLDLFKSKKKFLKSKALFRLNDKNSNLITNNSIVGFCISKNNIKNYIKSNKKFNNKLVNVYRPVYN